MDRGWVVIEGYMERVSSKREKDSKEERLYYGFLFLPSVEHK